MAIIGVKIIKTIGKIISLEVKHSDAFSTSLIRVIKINNINPETPEMIKPSTLGINFGDYLFSHNFTLLRDTIQAHHLMV